MRLKYLLKYTSSARIWALYLLACVFKGFAFVVSLQKRGFPRLQVRKVCSDVLESQWLGVGWRMVSESIGS